MAEDILLRMTDITKTFPGVKALDKVNFELKAGTLYPLLHALESKNYLTSYEESAGAGKPRKYYSITKGGRKFLTTKLDEWKAYSTAVESVLSYSV